MKPGRDRFKGWARLLAVIALCVSPTAAGPIQWSALGPEGGSATDFAIHPQDSSMVLLGSLNGIFRSSDGGSSWQHSSQGLGDPRVTCIRFDHSQPQRVFAATQGGVFASVDGGQTWQDSSQGLTDLSVEALVIDPANPDILYAATHDGVFKSSDGGSEWFASSAGIILDRRVINLAFSPSGSGRIYAVTFRFGVYRSDDQGQEWTRISSGQTGIFNGPILIDPCDETIYVSTSTGLLKTEDGLNWERVNRRFDIQQLAFDPLLPHRILAASPDGLFCSEDGGVSLMELAGPGFGNNLNKLVFDPGDPLTWFLSGPSGTFRSQDGGNSWAELIQGLHAHEGRSIRGDPTSPLSIYAGTAQGELRSIDGGLSWDSIATRTERSQARKLLIQPTNPRTILVARDARIYRSTTGGRSWIGGAELFDELVRTLAWAPSNPNLVYAGTGNFNSLYRSTNFGISWNYRGQQLPGSIDALAIDPTDGSTLYAGGSQGLYKSVNEGLNWQFLEGGLPASRIHCLAIDPMQPQLVYAGTSDAGIFKSSDGGQSWSALGGPSTAIIRSLLIDPDEPQRLWAGSWGEGVFFSPDGGLSWQAENQGLENLFVWELDLQANPRRLFAAALGGFSVLYLDSPPIPASFLEARMEVSGSAFAGGLLTYTITLRNAGQPDQAEQPEARFIASFSPLIEVIDARSESGVAVIGAGDNSISWTGQLEAGAQVIIEVRASVRSGLEGQPISALGQLSIDADADGDFESSVASHDRTSPAPGTPTTIFAQESLIDTELLAVPYDLGIESTFVGLAMVNFNSAENGIEYLALDGQGHLDDQRIEEAVLSRRGQIPFLTTEAFAEPTDTLAVRGTQAALSGYFMMGDLESNRLDGLGEALDDSQLLFFTEVRNSSQASTRFYLFNADPEHESSATLRLYSIDGLQIGETEVLVAPFGSLQAGFEELFGPLQVEDGFIRLEAERPLRGFELLVDPDRFAALSARAISLTEQLWAPHFFWNAEGGTSIVRLLNVGSRSVQASIAMRDDQGDLIAQAAVEVLPGQLQALDVRSLPEIAALPSGQGSMEVRLEAESMSPFPVLLPFLASITFDGGELGTLSSLPLLDQPESDTVYLQVAQSDQHGIFQGLAIQNPTRDFLVLTVNAYDTEGDNTAFRFLFLLPGQRFVGLLNDPGLFGEGFQQVGGYLQVRTSTGPFLSYVLFGGPRTLSALQGRPTP